MPNKSPKEEKKEICGEHVSGNNPPMKTGHACFNQKPCLIHSPHPKDWKSVWNKKFFEFQEMGAIKDTDEMKPFIRNLLHQTRMETKEEITQWAKRDYADHICGFNDGKNRCDCYGKALLDLLDLIKKI